MVSKPLLSAVLWLAPLAMLHAAERPNVLMIAVDDLNDWIGCLGGHPQARTPHIDRLARHGVLFTNAHCQSPVCNPSRVSLLSGLYPETSGIYFLNPPLWESKVAARMEVMPRRFAREDYHVTGAGKLFHHGGNQRYIPGWAGLMGGFGPFPKAKLSPFPGHPLWDWGAFPERDDQMPDHKLANWTVQELQRERDQPFFLMTGLVTTHVPQYVPEKWFALYPEETLLLPVVNQSDLDDVPPYAIDLTRKKHVAPTHAWVRANRQWNPLVRSYLACVSFVDDQVGRVLDALEASPYADDTVVVLFSDHGFHLGEKERWAKRSLWQDATGVPLIIAGPGLARGVVCDQPVQLLDIYPTVLDLAGLEVDPRLEGHSLRPLLEDPTVDWPHVARSSFGPGNIAITSRRHRYIHYADGSEELYDRGADPHEWVNLVGHPETKTILRKLRAHMPASWHPLLGRGSTGHQAFEEAGRRPGNE